MLDSLSANRLATALEVSRRRALLDFVYYLERVLGIECAYTREPRVRQYLAEYGSHVLDWLSTRHDKLPDGSLKQKVPRKIAVIVPRKTFKTSGVSQGGTPWALCHDPNLVCGIMSAAYEDLAIPIVQAIREHLDGSAAASTIEAHFGQFKRADDWSGPRFTIAQRTAALRDKSVTAYGVRRGAVGHHFDFFVIDDPVTNEAMSNDREWLDKVWRSYVDLKATLNPNALLTLVMTRYHDADLMGRIIEREIKPAASAANGGALPEDWNADSPECIKKYAHLAGWHVIYEQAVSDYDTDDPKYNFPGIWGQERIQEVRAGKSIDGDEESEEYSELFFWCQLQNTPQKREDNPIQEIHIQTALGFPKPHSIAEVPRTGWVDIHCDFAFKDADAYTKQRGDFTVAHVVVKHEGFVYRVNGYRGKPTQDMFGDELIRLATWAKNELKARVRFLSYDKLTGQGSGDKSTRMWIENLFRMHPSLRVPHIIEINRAGRNKTNSILGTAWAWQEGWVRLCVEAPYNDPLVYQMQRIGYSPHDDDADAFADSFHPEMYKVSARFAEPDDEDWNWTPALVPFDWVDEEDF